MCSHSLSTGEQKKDIEPEHKLSFFFDSQLVKITAWDLNVFLQLIVVNMALNQTWIALLIFILSAAPTLAFRLSPVLSSVAGFTSGFFIARDKTGWW